MTVQVYSESEGDREGALLRDRLALDRTLLANERTLLAYLRTALALLLTGASALRFLEGKLFRFAGFAAAGIGILTGAVGIFRYQAMRTGIRKSCAMPQASRGAFSAS